jgi:excisionase family DNA binding protein
MKASQEFLTTKEAAAHLDVTEHTLCVWRSSGRYRIRFYRIGRNVRYRRSDLDAWLESRKVDADVEPA